jgi:hypothetical protein
VATGVRVAAVDQNARSPNRSASSVITPAMTWARIILSSWASIAGIGSMLASWVCPEDTAGAPGPENSAWNSTWLTATDAASRPHESVRPASAVHTASESTNEAATPNQDGAASPPIVWENAATNVATAAAMVPRATRAHLESTSRPASHRLSLKCCHTFSSQNGVRT